MKKKVLLLAAVASAMLATNSYAQSKNKLKFGVNAIYGTQKNGNAELTLDLLKRSEAKFNNGFIFGIGYSFPIQINPILGENYNSTLDYPLNGDISDTGIRDDGALYLILGYRIGRVGLGIKGGASTETEYENAYNKVMGLYHTSRPRGEKGMFGVFTDVMITTNFSVNLGYDNYNHGTAGIGYKF